MRFPPRHPSPDAESDECRTFGALQGTDGLDGTRHDASVTADPSSCGYRRGDADPTLASPAVRRLFRYGAMKASLRHLLASGLLALPLLGHAAGHAPPPVSAATSPATVASAVPAGALEPADPARWSGTTLAALGLAVLVAAGFVGQRRRPD